MAAPVDRFRNGARSAPTYDVECELDHVISSVYALGSAFIAGTGRDFADRASRRLADLDHVASRLDTTPASDVFRADWNAYVSATRSVLEAILEADTRNAPG
jgi:hypothetical protein